MSILRKLLLATLPILLTSMITTIFIFNSGSASNDKEVYRASEMVKLVAQQELEMVKMAEALLGYILNSKDESKYAEKKAADEAYSKYSNNLIEYVQDDPEILKLNKEMADYDAVTLDKLENEVVNLVKTQSFEIVKATFQEKYLPARATQGKNFAKLKNLIFAKVSAINKEQSAIKFKSAIMTIIFLWVGILIGFFVIVTTSIKTMNQINAVASKLKNTSSQVEDAANKIANASKELSEATTEQAASLVQTSSAIEQTSTMVAKNSENAKSAATTSAKSQNDAEKGKQVVEKMIYSMDQINDSNKNIMNQINYSNNQFGEIVKMIQEIGDKTKVINDIVFQTKLLSFNASVEAARAGEQGKGFSVVAEEVGNLAQMSGNAAKEISELLNGSIIKVESIVVDTKAKVEALIHEGSIKVEEGAAVAKDCGEMLEEIVTNVVSVSRMAGEISLASEEQAQGVREITNAVNKLDTMTQQNATTSIQASEAAKNLANQVAAMNEGIHNLLEAIQGSHSS
ncbi:MAG: methyl-accepting chemotaxis protein [Pseudobdellovibrio sp.]